MAKLAQRRSENISGNFYVDSTCIDCDTCRWMAPEIFNEVGEQSAVYHQPDNQIEELRAMQALLSCPTASIGTVHGRRFRGDRATIKQQMQICLDWMKNSVDR